MSIEVKLKKGVNINLLGEADKVVTESPKAETFAVKPPDFAGVVPKMLVKAGEEVKAGSPLFFDKNNEKIVFSSPISGEVAEIKRGEKRRILEVIILADKEVKYEDYGVTPLSDMSREQIIEKMLKSGVWPLMRQRPFDVIANPDKQPKAIFVSAFNTGPMAADNDFIMHRKDELFQKGLDVLSKLTDGKVHLNINGAIKADETFLNAKGVQINKFKGPHPAGNVGVQIHHIDPINKNEVAWTLNPQDVLILARLFHEGKVDMERTIALTGSEVKQPKYYRMIAGQCIKNILHDNLKDGAVRAISGDVLTGTHIETDGYLGYYDDQITVIPEGGNDQFMGWLSPGLDKFSLSKTFLSWMTPKKKYRLNTNLNGEERAFVMTGEYEKVFPMDIYPVHLLKAIMIEDIELMEKLGIYEVAPEDFALCEFGCTSKIDIQEIVRQGLDVVRKETD